MGGKSASSTDVATPPSSEELYPPIRQLPILGIAYADLYREAKVQEAVFETLTKQYEMAKVEEARETPSVKVLDEGDVPEGKSFPPRTLLVALGIFLSFVVGSVWVLTSTWWHALNPQDPGKKLLQEVARYRESQGGPGIRPKIRWTNFAIRSFAQRHFNQPSR